MKCLWPILQQLATTSFSSAVQAAKAVTAKGSARSAWGCYWSTVLALWCTCHGTSNVCNACCCWLLCIQLCRSPASCQPPGSTSHQLPPLLWHNTLQRRQMQLAASAAVGWCTAARLWHDSLVLAGSVQPVVAALTSSVTRRCVWRRRKQPVHDACVAFMHCVPVVSPGVLQCRVRAAWPSCCHWVPPVPGKLWDRLVCCLQCRD